MSTLVKYIYFPQKRQLFERNCGLFEELKIHFQMCGSVFIIWGVRKNLLRKNEEFCLYILVPFCLKENNIFIVFIIFVINLELLSQEYVVL